jgi:hypothetical protein
LSIAETPKVRTVSSSATAATSASVAAGGSLGRNRISVEI